MSHATTLARPATIRPAPAAHLATLDSTSTLLLEPATAPSDSSLALMELALIVITHVQLVMLRIPACLVEPTPS